MKLSFSSRGDSEFGKRPNHLLVENDSSLSPALPFLLNHQGKGCSNLSLIIIKSIIYNSKRFLLKSSLVFKLQQYFPPLK